MKISPHTIVRILQGITHILFFYGVWYSLHHNVINYLYGSVFLYYFLGVFGVNMGYHRYLSHASFKVNKFYHYLMISVGTLAVMGSPLGWVSTHRQHHRFSDTDKDPHSPHRIGFFKSWFGFWGDFNINSMCKDLRKDPYQMFLHNNYLLINITYCFILCMIDPLFVVYLYAFPAVMVFHSAGIFDSVAHLYGYRRYETNDQSRNSWIANIFTVGEGWHNNHHANPSNYTTQEKWWEIDPTGWFINLIRIK